MTKNSLSSKSVIAIVSIILVLYFPIESFAARKVSKIPGTDSVNLVWDSDKDLVKNFRREGNNYAFKSNIRTILEHSPTGATRAGVPTIFEASVSRKAVLSGAFRLVKAGAKLALKAAPYVGAASYAYDAYQLVNPTLESAGYHYSANADTYLKVYDNALCLGKFMSQPGYYSCVGVDSSVMLALSKGGKSAKDAQTLLTMQVQSDYEKIHKGLMDQYFGDEYARTSPKCRWNGWGVSCHIQTLSIAYGFIKNYSEELTPDKFLEIATNTIDSNPTPFVEGTGKPEYKENIKVPAGTVVTIGPVTPENGKPVQITITFGQDSNGNTTANVSTTQRPDLDPGSPEAPKSKPDGNPDSNPDGKPDKKPDGNPDDKPDKRPDDKPDPDDDPSDKDKRKEDKKDDKKEESKGLLCDFFPDILACDKMGKPEKGMFDDIKIPQVTDEKTWDSDNFLPPNGVCPQPKSFNIWGRPVQISYEPLCVFMEKVRFAVLLGFIIMSAFIVFGSLRKG
ncbi:TspB protein [Neisseria flavescens]|uniref:IgG-binding virulence factor TspB family protein n=1 Tax=Neisseria flavescens TaxID=484 RepID=UPI000DD612AC|nr:IgG-binding virulence factor TspB family protein [Neisseria flavescens]QCL68300.1 TspB protein [Neisseria flavescens]QCL69230.1 TspB protein [Neisseria flavescens]